MAKTKKQNKQNKFWQTAVITVLIVSIIGVSAPQPTHAVFPVESYIKNAWDVGTQIWEKLQGITKKMAGIAFKKALRSFLSKLAYDTAVWIGSGDEKQKPLIFTKDAGEYMRDAGDAALGEFLDTLAEQAGLPNLCNLPDIPKLQFQTMFTEPEKPDCTFSEIMDEVSGLYDSAFEAMQGSAASLMSDPKRTTLYIENEYKGEGVMDTFVKALEMGTGYKREKEEESQIERLIQGSYKAVTNPISETVKTPAETVQKTQEGSIEKATETETTTSGEILADAVNTFTSTLISQLLKRMMSGLFSFATESDVSSSVSGSSQVALGGGSESAKGRSGGIAAAKEQFASFQTVSFTAAGVVDILNDFASCPDTGAQVTNCVISDSFRQAIEEKMTLKEAVEQGVFSPDTPFAFTAEGAITDPQKGLPYRGVKVLKQYSVVPVGWELAAEFINDFGSSSQSIGSLMDAYTKCGPEAENYSPFCGLIDPSWVLKAPEVFCKQKGFGETLGADYFSDSDSHPMTPEKRNVVRSESCTDTQSCLSEDATGKCEAYGYCTKQRRIYRFQGTECPAYKASCEVYADTESGEEAAYLSNTLNNNDCTADNASCQWYCSKYDTTAQTFTCADQNDGAIYFDRDASECEEDDSGCNEFIPIKGGANLLFNSSFEQYAGTIDDSSDSDTFGYNLDGNPCSGFEETCYGWRFGDGAQGQAVTTASSGSVGLKLPTTGYVAQIPDTGSSITNRSFILSYDYRNLSSSACEGKMWFRDGASSTASTTKEFKITYEPSDQFQRVSNLYTFPDDDFLGTPFVYSAIGAVGGCEVIIDKVKLEENSATSNYSDYGASLVYLNTEKAAQCSVSDIGCELYTPRTGESDYQIPGLITNALSTICTDANGNADYANPECSQCPQEYIGCDSYIEVGTLYDAPIKDEMGFGGPEDVPTDDLRKAIGKRKGQYCDNNQDTSCLTDDDCSGGAACVQATSIIPEQGDDCSVAEVGCEEYVNLDKQGEGGEVLEYYTLIKQCVKPTEAQKNDNELNTYYTFEGSDQSGYQLRTWYLKKSDEDNGPCTHLDLYGESAESSEADCIDSTEGVLDCQANFGTDPDCLLFYDSSGIEYYRPQSAIITVSEDCHPLRNSLDERIYYSIPDESESCSAGANRCREYKGSQGSKVEIILNETFDKSVWEGGELSSVVVTAGNGQSMAIGNDTTSHSENASIVVGNSLEQGASYILSFWAKHGGSSVEPLYAFIVNNGSNLFYFNDDSNNDGLQITSNWKRYFLGPVVIDKEITADDKFAFKYEGSLVYIDNVELQKNTDSYYIVAGSAPMCMGYEGCEEYKDSNKNKHYLKSFTKLCDANLVGCQSLLTTENSTTPFPTTYNNTNEFDSDNVFVDADHPIAYSASDSRSMYLGNGVGGFFIPVGWEATRQTYVVNKKTMCNSEAAGCDRFGLAQEDESGNLTYTPTFWINDPDTYSSTLCQEQQLQCREYESSEGSTVYFKDPQEKICTYDSGSGSWKQPDGSECPLQNDDPAAVPSQPKGPVCKDGLRKDKLCNSDQDCPNSDGTTFSRCDSESSQDFGWVGECTPEYAGCTQYFDPLSENNNELPNSDFESDVEDNSDPSQPPDSIPDNWNLLTTASTYFKPNITTLTSSCTFQQSDGQVFEGQRSAYAGSGAGVYCLTGSEDVIPIDENSYYTLSGNVFLSLDNSNFSIGLLYYDSNGAELNAGTDDAQSYAIAAYEGANRSANNPPDTGKWNRFIATIGPNLEREFPAGTAFIKVFLEFSSSSAQSSLLYFDNISFSENDQYTYIDNTIDGAPENEQNTCNGEVVMEDECVAFREATNKNLVYLSIIEEEKESAAANSTEFVTETCTFNSGVETAACNSRKNTADTNVVIKVENDRECAEWLSCSSSRISYDASGNEVGTTCLDIGTCTKRNKDTGVCTQWRTKKQNIDGGDDRMIISQAGDTWELKSARNVAGYSTVGINWQGGSCNSGSCSGGALNGSTCSNNDDCNPLIQGYYPYDWMPQKGLGGSGYIKEMVSDNDFEDVFCDGEADYAALSQYENISSVERSRDLSLRCSLDRHCRTRDIDNTVSALLKEANSKANVQSLYYEEGWCDNVDGQTSWKDWSTIGEDATSKATMQIIDYDPNQEYEKDDRQGTISALSLDLNNDLFVQPANNGFSGVAVDLKDMIVPDQEYTLSFDAQYVGSPNTDTDFIQIGIEHTQPEVAAIVNNIVDLVFVLDVSASMDDYIANVSTALQTLADNLDVANIQARYAIVITGPNNNNPHVLDFDDYTDYGPYFGSSNGITKDFTTDADEFKQVLDDIVSNFGGGWGGHEDNYEALVNIANNQFSLDSNYGLNFSTDAPRFVVLLSDQFPESSDPYVQGHTNTNAWDEEDEDALMDGVLSSKPYELHVVTLPSGKAYDSYDELAAFLDGGIYDISLTNYSSIFNAISASIEEAVEPEVIEGNIDYFDETLQFDENYKRYTLGPLKIEHKASANDTSNLFFAQTNGSSNVPFVLDNISLKPTLEVNTQGSPNGEGSPWEISRDCRAYPEQKSLSCDYKNDASGVIYEGWKGYCLAKDPMDSKQCIAWWPVDILSGERDLTNRLTVRYSGKYPVYQCLVAKGNAKLGACSKNQKLCSDDEECGSGNKCIGGSAKDDFSGAHKWSGGTEQIEHNIIANDYTITHKVSLGVGCNSQGNNCPDTDDWDAASFVKVDATALERSFHISELDYIKFYSGTPKLYSGTEERYWGKMGSIDTRELELSEDAPLIKFAKGEDGANGWGYNVGIWCGEAPCTAENIDEYLEGDISLIYVNVPWYTDNVESVVETICGASVNTGDEECGPYNPFSEIAADKDGFNLTPNAPIWGADKITLFPNVTESSCHGSYSKGGTISCGDGTSVKTYNSYADIAFARVQFEGGYLKALYFGRMEGSGRDASQDVKYIEDITWEFHLKEPCLLAVEGVNKEAETIPWYTRVREGSSYIVSGLGYGYKMLNGQSKVYGSMGNDPRNVTPDKIDGDEEEFKDETQLIDWTASAPDNLPLVYANGGVGSSLPYACIGDCGALVCEDNYDTTQTPYGEVSCEKNLWIGAGLGYCSKPNPDNGQQELCTQNADGTTTGCSDPDATCEESEHKNSGVGSNNNSYTEQLVAAAKEGWSRYRLLFADIGDTVWYAPQDPEDSSRFLPYLAALGKTSLGTTSEKPFDEDDDGINDFKDNTTMKECPNATREPNEYCGIRPSIDNIELAIDDKTNADVDGTLEVPNGSAAKLIFDSYANEDQVPIEKIRIAWESTSSNPANFNDNPYIIDPWEASPSNNHTYTHVYTCDPTSSYYSKTDAACVYYIHIQLEDHWKFCSGEKGTSLTRSTEGACTSYDTFNPKIIVKP